jgi:predicted dehydrogenase/threonine dehydrogenase-like Zn-dependent dehydrogenase
MRQLVQSVRSGELTIVEAPDPVIGPTEVLVQTTHSVVSAGTERAVRELASASLLQKAKARPDLVRQVIRKAREDGIRATTTAVRARLEDDMPLGYSGAGVVLQVGEAVSGIRPGTRVATGGAGHSDLQVVAGLLAVPVPGSVANEQAAFATVASIALHGLRLADVGPGGSICVVGLGLIGQLTARLALASGLRVFGVDLREWTVDRASSAGAVASVEQGDATTRAIVDWSRGRGADAVLLTAATSSSTPVQLAPERLRDRGTVVVVGDVGLDLKRTPFYEKELSLRVARSYGPGRYDRSYEDWSVDYPVGQVRFTEGRNLESVLGLMEAGSLDVGDLVTHRFAFDQAKEAYGVLGDSEAEYLGIQLEYGERRPTPVARPRTVRAGAEPSISLIGAGSFAKGVLLPAIREAKLGTVLTVSSEGGTSAARLAERIGATATSVDDALGNDSTEIAVIATSHDSHAELVVRALRAGKDVFCEKPLALTVQELDEVRTAWSESGSSLAVGLNRRHAPDVAEAKRVLGGSGTPIVVNYRVNAGTLPASHWYFDRRQGGRLIGEVCHFIDTCNAVVGSDVVEVASFGDQLPESLLSQSLVVTLGYADGSVASITYASGGHPNTTKERIEILGRGHTVLIDDFRSIEIDGQSMKHHQDKGHTAQLVAWSRARASGSTEHTLSALASMLVTLEAASRLSDMSGRRS